MAQVLEKSSNIGAILIGKQVGDTVKVQIPGGMRELEIIQLITIHEVTE